MTGAENFFIDIKGKSATNSLVSIIIVVSIVMFAVRSIFPMADYYVALPGSFLDTMMRPWTIVTHMFVSLGFVATFMDILALSIAGSLMLRDLSGRQLTSLFFFSGIVAGVVFQMLSGVLNAQYIVGCHGAIAGVVAASATMNHSRKVLMPFFGTVKYLWVAIAILLFMVINRTQQPGALALIAGGAVGGYVFAMMFKNGTDISKPIAYCADKLMLLFESKKKDTEQDTQQYHYAQNIVNNTVDDITADDSAQARQSSEQADINDDSEDVRRILNKIKTSGYDSLTDDEKRRIFK